MSRSQENDDFDRLVAGFALALAGAEAAELRAYVREGVGRLPPGASLFHWDANSVHGYVFDTTNASVIRGASGMLKQLDAELAVGTGIELQPSQILYAGGGAGFAVVRTDKVPVITARLHEVLALRTRVATVTTTAVPLEPGQSFAEAVSHAGRSLARERGLQSPDAESAVPFFAERCAICGRRAAAEQRKRTQGPRLECAPCGQRVETAKGLVARGGEADNFDDLKDSREFYAVLYLDGNGIGRTIQGLRSPWDYYRFSRALADLIRDGFAEVAQRYDLMEAGAKGGTYQLPISGGDDLVAILPAAVAVPLARDLLAHLEREADASEILRDPPIGACVGIALAKSGFPIRHLLLEAEALLKVAKRRIYASGGTVRSALTYALVLDGSPRAESVEPERFGAPAGHLLRSGLPYSLPEFERFSERLRAFRAAVGGVGNSQLHAMLRFGQAGPNQLRNHALYQVARHPAWLALVRNLAGAEPDAVLGADAAFEQIAPHYGDTQIFDLPDLLPLLDHWQEPPMEVPA